MESDSLKKVEKNQIKTFAKLEKLKNDYFLQKIFHILEKKKMLYIVKYNKKIMKRINININDYKEYSKLIVIEIKPVNNEYGQFINIKEIDKLYYHIYFNNKKEEIKRNYINKDEQIDIIKIIIDKKIESFEGLFCSCECIESIYFKKFYRNNINNMSFMFYYCWSLKELNLSNFNTENVIRVIEMFAGCSSLKELDLSNFYLSKIKYTHKMFYSCSSLEKLYLFYFNTYRIEDMGYMFYNCSSLKKLDISNFDFNNVMFISYMFSGCSQELKNNIISQNKNIKDIAFH